MNQDKPPAPAQTAAELDALLAAAKPGAGAARTASARGLSVSFDIVRVDILVNLREIWLEWFSA